MNITQSARDNVNYYFADHVILLIECPGLTPNINARHYDDEHDYRERPLNRYLAKNGFRFPQGNSPVEHSVRHNRHATSRHTRLTAFQKSLYATTISTLMLGYTCT